MLQKIRDGVYIERLLNESPSWIGIALIISMTVMGAGFVLMLGILSLHSSSSSSIVAEGVALVMSFVGVLATLGVFLYAVHITYQTEHLTPTSESEVVTYVSQMSNEEYNELKQQVELNHDLEIEDNDLKAIDKLLIEKMLPRRNRIIFFRTGW